MVKNTNRIICNSTSSLLDQIWSTLILQFLTYFKAKSISGPSKYFANLPETFFWPKMCRRIWVTQYTWSMDALVFGSLSIHDLWFGGHKILIVVRYNGSLTSFIALQTYILCVRKDLIYADTFGIPSIHDLWFM